MIHDLLRLLIERKYRLDSFKRLKAPEGLIESAESLYKCGLEKVKNELKINGEEYLASIQGQIDAVEIISQNAIDDKYNERCGRCKKFQMKNTDFCCELYDKKILSCGNFEDCGMDLIERLNLSSEVCGECINSVVIDEFDFDCKIKGLDMFKCNECTHRRRK